MQRICWNELGWRGPSGSVPRSEKSYAGENGFGHEEWNFDTSSPLGGQIAGYSYYSPALKHEAESDRHQIYFFAIRPDKARVLVGHYRNARFVRGREQQELRHQFEESTLLDLRIAQLRALGLGQIPNDAVARHKLTHEFALNILVAPEDVVPFDPHFVLTAEHIGGGDPLQLTRYTTPKELGREPPLSRFSSAAESTGSRRTPTSGRALSLGTTSPLIEDAYLTRSKAELRVIARKHNELSNRFRQWLHGIGCVDIIAESDRVDVRCHFAGNSCLFELKTAFGKDIRHAIREALGQLLEYNYFPGRTQHRALAIVLDSVPGELDIAWLARLTEVGWPVELLWLKGETVYAAGIGNHVLSKFATR